MITEQTALGRALKVTPRASQTASKAPGEVGPRLAPGEATEFPLFACEGSGAYIVDDRGRKYLDCFGANAAIPLGYAHPEVVEAVTRALRRGSLLSLPHVMEAEVSEQFLAACAPWADQVRWVKSGSEACHAAYLTAKEARGGDLVMVGDWAYHGWHEWTKRDRDTSRRVTSYPHGYDLDQLAHADEVCAVFVEPHRWEWPKDGWLEGVRAFCDRTGAVLIFDEMVYGLRWAMGGGAEYYGVRPDLTCFGKALGNGVPIACVAGRRDLMEACGRVVSGTYGGETLGLAAAGAVLDVYNREDVIGRLWERGRALWDGFVQAGGPECGARLDGTYVHWRLAGLSPEQLDETLARCARDGHILVHRASNNASAAMTHDEAWGAGHIIANIVKDVVEATA